jgi:sec-independent protein translocase protein TatC
MLAKYRRHAIVGAAIFAAVVTPTTDPFNMTLMFVPTYVFYEVGIFLARMIGSRRAERKAAIAAEESGSRVGPGDGEG